MKREMVCVRIYEDGEYEIKAADSSRATQHLYGYETAKGRNWECYYCPKSEWKKHLLKLLSTESIDVQITELKEKRKRMEQMRSKILTELETEYKEGEEDG